MRRVIIDTDTAGDDTIALLTTLHHFKVEGVTITGGNVAFNQEVENALYTIQVAALEEKVPVYKGLERPLNAVGMTAHRTVEDVHGKDGMGGAFFDSATQRPETTHAVDFIIETIRKNPGEIELLAIAPLTNIAMAFQKDPGIIPLIAHVYVMGGTNNSLGNITAAAEYNFWVDPEAANIVLQSGVPVTMVGWDMCVAYSVMDEEDHREIEDLNTTGSRFFTAVNKVVRQFNKEVHRLPGTTHPDTLLTAIAADESIMTESHPYYVEVETQGRLTRGYSMVDINNRSGCQPNVRVCEAVDREKYKQTLIRVLSSIE
ncbi:nucleoside hydrolase [Halobacillus kuroshimensis]|uniref:Nucleoside hydrolase n=1 Tax=Halobacillus kuroshimensis TaxID=302481 RepID=A0ABS3DWB5_9BACI|nr:nucleoside hydrolase [Halobacillus kuroshimensis]MBN8235637.1 nucleoside hydrolase [Halobacillus kuroshimensis]